MSSERQELPYGLYELTKSEKTLALAIPEEAEWAETTLEADEASHIPSLSRYLAEQISRRLEQARPKERVAIVNSLLNQLADDLGPDAISSHDGKGGITQLTELKPKAQNSLRPRPATPLSEVALLTNNPKEPNLAQEIQKELESADRVDLLCSFLKLTGVNVLRKQLDTLKARGIPFRVITTTYMGATDRRAVDLLVEQYGAQVKVSYEKNSTRLHAKAWIFHRNSGFTTGYVGSSNLSHAALTEGLEWNVRISQPVTPGILQQFEAAFQGYWESPQFEPYTASDEDRARLDRALEESTFGRGAARRPNTEINFSHVDVHPYPHQAVMLDELTAARAKGYHRNLAVAATGTGKTILSALDYRSLRESYRRDLKLLFIAHQEEILRQSRSAYATVMRDANFGEFLLGGQRPETNQHVFATVQTLSAGAMENYSPEHFDVVVIDEFHHAEATTYRKVIDYFKPKEFLGLTATPERGDGKNVALEFFDGRIATQLRLWDALSDDLLVPFHYYGINDGTDLSGIRFLGGKYNDSDLTTYYLANKSRVAIILNQLADKVANPGQMRAIGFCVNVAHAQFMADAFNKAGLPATCLVGSDSSEQRADAIRKLKDPEHELCIIFTVNLFNEGVDIPEVDTLLMLRPTQSPTLFQQQLGRGLRRSPDKAVLVVLDFVGIQAKGFRFDLKMRAFSRSGYITEKEVKDPQLPAGSSIILDKMTQDQVLNSIKQALNPKIDVLVDQVKMLTEELKGKQEGMELFRTYLDRYGLGLENIYGRTTPEKSGLTFTYLLDSAQPQHSFPMLYEKGSRTYDISSRIRALAHVNDAQRISAYTALLTTGITEKDMSVSQRRTAWMLLYSFWPYGKFKKGEEHQKFTLDEGLAELRKHPYFIQELQEIWNYNLDADRHAPQPSPRLGSDIPLQTHSYYSREEIFAALGGNETAGSSPGGSVSGVLEAHATNTIALNVTLNKSEKHYSPETMYKDYAITESEFAWDSQNSTTPDSRLGQIYQTHEDHKQTPLLFVRYEKDNQIGTAPYLFVGPVSYRSHTGSQPMHITWQLERKLPAELFNLARAAA